MMLTGFGANCCASNIVSIIETGLDGWNEIYPLTHLMNEALWVNYVLMVRESDTFYVLGS